MADLDETVTRWINGEAGTIPLLDILMMLTTTVGVILMLFLIAAQWWWEDDGGRRRHLRHVIVATGISCVVGFIVNQLIVIVVHRVRPYDAGVTQLLVAPSSEWSFPSDHATVAVAIPTALWLHADRARAAIFAPLAFLVVISRVYVGAHYAGDVVGGTMTAIAAAILARELYREGTPLDHAITNLL